MTPFRVSEPMTAATDAVLAVVSLLLAFRLGRESRHRPGRLFAATLAASGAAALTGGTYHAILPSMSETAAALLWFVTVVLAGAAGVALLLAALQLWATPFWRAVIGIVAVTQFAAYCIWTATHDGFVWVLVEYGACMLAAGALSVRDARSLASRWLLTAIAISAVAAGLQAAGIGLPPYLGHNDLYHLVQIAAIAAFYRAGRAAEASAAAPPAAR